MKEGSETIGSRATGNDGGSYLVAGPGWKGRTPNGVKEVIRSETDWLPAPKGPFSMIMRLYWPKVEATEGKWTAPPLHRAQ
jgi:hypothetical protein